MIEIGFRAPCFFDKIITASGPKPKTGGFRAKASVPFNGSVTGLGVLSGALIVAKRPR